MLYIVVLGPAATRIIQSLNHFDQRELKRVLNDELADGPNADKEVRFDSHGHAQRGGDRARPGRLYYTATPLSHRAYTAIHRPMSTAELSMATRARRDQATDLGFYVLDILVADSAFTPGLGGLAAGPGP
jgi:hypothetical protein